MRMTRADALAALQRCSPRMRLAEVGEWATQYVSSVDDDKVIDAIAPAVRARGYFLRDEFLQTYRWKTHRTLHHAEKNSEADVANVTADAFRQTDEKRRITLLRGLHGVEWPVASTLLHVGLSADYPIIDFRALWSLGSDMPSSMNFEFWCAYVQCCRKLAATAGVSVRTLDQALWAYSAAKQPKGRALRSPSIPGRSVLTARGTGKPDDRSMSMSEIRRVGKPHEIMSVEEFRERRAAGVGVIVVADGTRLPPKAHSPGCSRIKEETFVEKVVKNGGKEGLYYYFSAQAAAHQVMNAKPCFYCGATPFTA